MSELLSQIMTPELQMALTLAVVLVVLLYVLSIIWVVRDAYLRGVSWKFWGVIALIPVFGLIAYCILRPPLMKIDQDEQKLEIAIKKRELTRYGECSKCGYPVESDFVMCPKCLTRLKNLCPVCRRACDPTWPICPYCATQLLDEVPAPSVPEHPRSSRTGTRTRERTGSPERRSRGARA